MLSIPQGRAVRILLVHVDVIETLRGKITLIFDDRPIGSLQIRKSGAALGLEAFSLSFGDLFFGESQHAACTGPRVGADKSLRATIGRGEHRQQLYFAAVAIGFEVLPNIGHMPAEMPDRALWTCWRRRLHAIEQHVHGAAS